ncbi:MAG: T9SS type A sorting domain-containing protein [Bacteroidia bacterium]|nr:T9SS type A sorting domain-containing protein [Bacteroidia bacterium]
MDFSLGGTGTNDNDDTYDVQGIGIDDAALIAYWNHTNLLQSGAQYADARAGSIAAATLLFGACSNQEIQTTNAWAAVGVGTPSTCAVTGIIDNMDNSPVLYPNPATHTTTLSFARAGHRLVQLYSLDGALVQRIENNHATSVEISTLQLPQGIYMVRIHEAGQVITLKLIKY